MDVYQGILPESQQAISSHRSMILNNSGRLLNELGNYSPYSTKPENEPEGNHTGNKIKEKWTIAILAQRHHFIELYPDFLPEAHPFLCPYTFKPDETFGTNLGPLRFWKLGPRVNLARQK